MRSFIGIQPDIQTREKIREVVEELLTAFRSQDINISPVDPDRYLIEVFDLGESFNLAKRISLEIKMKKFRFNPFSGNFDSVKLGLSKKDKGVLLFTINDGAEELRETVLRLINSLNLKREKIFIPHLAIGRVTKDLSDEEYKNLNLQLRSFKSLSPDNPLGFGASFLSFIQFKKDNQTVWRKLSTL